MKKTIKNTIFSLLVAIAILLGAYFPLAYVAVNSLSNTAQAEYKPTDFRTPYEFSSTQSNGWLSTKKTIDNSDVNTTFSDSSVSKNISSVTEYKPSTNYKGESTDVTSGTSTDFGAMLIKANETPTTAEVEKIVDNVVQFKTDENGDFVYIKGDDGQPKEYSSNDGDTERFVLIEEGVYYQKEAEMETINVYCYYETSSSLDLAANSYYVICAYVCTFSTDASIMVTGTKYEEEFKIENTNGEWELVYMFLETSSDSKNSVKLRFYYGDSEGVSKDLTSGATESGAAYLDHVTVQTINKTDYQQQTVGGENPTEGASVFNYSPRYDYTQIMENINYDFETVTDNGDGTYAFNLYEELYGTDDYDKDNDLIVNQGYYQYYINKYTSDDGSTKLTDKQLSLYHKAYNEKLTTSVVLESKEFETEEEVTDESGNVVLDGNQNPKTETVPAESTFNLNNHVLKLENTSEKYSLGVLSAPIVIKQFGYYKLTLFAKGLSSEDSATVKLISYIKTGTSSEEGTMIVKSQTVSPYATDKYSSNNWTEINFYIQGSSYYDTTMQIALLADKESTIYYDEIRLEGITSTTYTGSTATSSKKFDLFPSSTTITSSITNGNFDSVTTDDVDPSNVTKPYTPYNWDKVDGSSEDVVAGIISSNQSFYEFATDSKGTLIKELLGLAENPIKDYELNGATISPAKTNLLAMYAPATVDGEDATHTYAYKSQSISLSSSSAYQITFEVYYDNTNENSNFIGNVYANLILNSENIAEFSTEVEESISSDMKGKWVKYTFLVHTGSASKSVYLELGIKDAVGTVFFQKVRYTKLAEKTVDGEKISVDTQFDELVKAAGSLEEQNQNNIRVVSFEKDPFNMHSNDKVADKDYYESLSHSLKTETNSDDEAVVVENQGEIGIVDLNELDGLTLKSDPSYNLEASFMKNPKSESNFALVIYNDQNYNTTVIPSTDVSLSSSSYYEISLYVKTKDISEGNGLKIYMDKISVTFENINTETNQYGDLTDSNGYKKFTVYVRTGTSTLSGLKITYELGQEDNMFTGTALVTDLRVTKLADEAAYNELVDAVDSSDATTVIKNFAVDSTEHDHTHDHADSLTLATFFLVFSSLLLVAALIFALVSVSIRKNSSLKLVGFNKAKKDSHKNSDAPKDGFI